MVDAAAADPVEGDEVLVSAGGGAVAQLDGGGAPPASVGTAALKDGAVTGIKIADGTPVEVKSNQAVIDAYLGVAH